MIIVPLVSHLRCGKKEPALTDVKNMQTAKGYKSLSYTDNIAKDRCLGNPAPPPFPDIP